MILGELFGNETAEKVLLYIESYGSGYGLAIAETFECAVSQVQRQLERFEREGVLVSRLVGKTRLYEWNPRYYFLEELRRLLAKALKSLPTELTERFFRSRTRPRRKGKPL